MWGSLFSYILLFAFLVTIGYTLVTVGVLSAKKDSQQQLTAQIQTIGIANFFLILIFGFLSSYYIESYPTQFTRYVLVMIHVALFLSLMAVSIATLQQV